MNYIWVVIVIVIVIVLSKSKSSFNNNLLLNALSNKKYFVSNLKIPKVVHKIYIDSTGTLNNIDPIIYTLLDSFKKMNPEYAVKIWSGNDCKKYLKNNFDISYLNCFNNFIPYAYKADFFRYCVVYKEGGWYSDLKEDILYPLDSINNNNYSFIGIVDIGNNYCLKNFCLQNAFFASIPNHPILKECIDKCIDNSQKNNYGNHNLEPTGPRLFGESLETITSMPDNFLFGYFIHDIPGGSHHINNKRVIIHKCDDCKQGNNWEYGNNYIELWIKKNIFFN